MNSAQRKVVRMILDESARGLRLQDSFDAELVNRVFRFAIKKQSGVSLKYMLDFGSRPIEKQMVLSAQFLHAELPIRLAHRVAELENLPYGLSSMKPILKARRGRGHAWSGVAALGGPRSVEHGADVCSVCWACWWREAPLAQHAHVHARAGAGLVCGVVPQPAGVPPGA